MNECTGMAKCYCSEFFHTRRALLANAPHKTCWTCYFSGFPCEFVYACTTTSRCRLGAITRCGASPKSSWWNGIYAAIATTCGSVHGESDERGRQLQVAFVVVVCTRVHSAKGVRGCAHVVSLLTHACLALWRTFVACQCWRAITRGGYWVHNKYSSFRYTKKRCFYREIEISFTGWVFLGMFDAFSETTFKISF